MGLEGNCLRTPLEEGGGRRTSISKRTTDLKLCFSRSAVTGGITMENAVFSNVPRCKLSSGAVLSSGTVLPRARGGKACAQFIDEAVIAFGACTNDPYLGDSAL